MVRNPIVGSIPLPVSRRYDLEKHPTLNDVSWTPSGEQLLVKRTAATD